MRPSLAIICVIIAGVAAIVLPGVRASSGITVDPQTSFFVDELGRVRIYHGVNVVYKTAPFYPPVLNKWDPMLSFSEQDAQYLSEWGQNVIRLYMSWQGYETAPGQFNETYIQTINQIVQTCAKYNISVLLDMHQDLFSFYFCGEGVPDFYVSPNRSFPEPFKYDLPRTPEGYPVNVNCTADVRTFAQYYFSYDVARFSQELTLNKRDLATKMARFWQKVATYFRDAPNVLGYELINEPWGIDQYEDPVHFLWPGYWNNHYMLPFYRIINNAIRQVDNESLVFYEPVVSDFLNGGFNESVGGPEYQNREVFSYHVYCPFVNRDSVPDSTLKQILCAVFDDFEFSGKLRNAQKIQVGGFLTEFGAILNSTQGIKELKRVLQNADKRFQSVAYWQYKYYDDITTASPSPNTEGLWDENGNLQANKVAVLARPYAYAICGKPLQMEFDYVTKKFTLVVETTSACTSSNAPTEVYLSEEFFYPRGVNAKLDKCNTCTFQKVRKSYYAITGTELLPVGWEYTLEVTPRLIEDE